MRSYEYRCKDYSLLTPLFKQVFVTPLVGLLPVGLPANIITIISNCFFYLAFYLAIDKELLGNLNFIVIPILLLAYLVGNHLDGAQARRTKTESALGEFCDHFPGAFNNGFLIFILFSLFTVTEQWLIGVVLFTSYLAHTVAFYEQFKSGWLIFETLGSLEGTLLSILLIIMAYFTPVYNLYVSTIYSTLSIFDLFLIFTTLGVLLTFIKTIKRVPNVTYGIWLYTVLLAVTTIFGVLMFNALQSTILITLYASWYIGKLKTAHLVDGVERSTGLFTPLLMIVAYFLHSLHADNTFIIVSAYLGINILLLVYRTYSTLKSS